MLPCVEWRCRAVGFVVLAFSWAGAAAGGAAEPVSPQTTFFHANALYKDGQYTAAAQEYESLLQSGRASGSLYFNLGNAYFKAGDKGRALLNYERAQRLIPNDPDLRANLAYAQSLTDVAPCTPSLWQRLAFPLAHRLSTTRLAWAATISYTLLFAVLIAYQLWPRRPRWLFYGSIAVALVFAMVATALAHQVVSEDWQQYVVVLPGGETASRFEPASSGTVHFVLKQGALVRVLETRQGWLQIERCDGRRGWIERGTAADL